MDLTEKPPQRASPTRLESSPLKGPRQTKNASLSAPGSVKPFGFKRLFLCKAEKRWAKKKIKNNGLTLRVVYAASESLFSLWIMVIKSLIMLRYSLRQKVRATLAEGLLPWAKFHMPAKENSVLARESGASGWQESTKKNPATGTGSSCSKRRLDQALISFTRVASRETLREAVFL